MNYEYKRTLELLIARLYSRCSLNIPYGIVRISYKGKPELDPKWRDTILKKLKTVRLEPQGDGTYKAFLTLQLSYGEVKLVTTGFTFDVALLNILDKISDAHYLRGLINICTQTEDKYNALINNICEKYRIYPQITTHPHYPHIFTFNQLVWDWLKDVLLSADFVPSPDKVEDEIMILTKVLEGYITDQKSFHTVMETKIVKEIGEKSMTDTKTEETYCTFEEVIGLVEIALKSETVYESKKDELIHKTTTDVLNKYISFMKQGFYNPKEAQPSYNFDTRIPLLKDYITTICVPEICTIVSGWKEFLNIYKYKESLKNFLDKYAFTVFLKGKDEVDLALKGTDEVDLADINISDIIANLELGTKYFIPKAVFNNILIIDSDWYVVQKVPDLLNNSNYTLFSLNDVVHYTISDLISCLKNYYFGKTKVENTISDTTEATNEILSILKGIKQLLEEKKEHKCSCSSDKVQDIDVQPKSNNTTDEFKILHDYKNSREKYEHSKFLKQLYSRYANCFEPVELKELNALKEKYQSNFPGILVKEHTDIIDGVEYISDTVVDVWIPAFNKLLWDLIGDEPAMFMAPVFDSRIENIIRVLLIHNVDSQSLQSIL